MGCDSNVCGDAGEPSNSSGSLSSDFRRRSQFVTKLPSSSLLPLNAFSRRAGSASDLDDFSEKSAKAKFVGTVIIRLDEKCEDLFVRSVTEEITSLPEDAWWCVARSIDEPGSWLILETTTTTTAISTSIHGKESTLSTATGRETPATRDSSLSPVGDPASADTSADTCKKQDADSLRNQSEEYTVPSVAHFLKRVHNLLKSPPDIQRSRILLDPQFSSPALDAVTIAADSTKRPSYVRFLRETVKTKEDHTHAFIDTCRAFQETLAAQATEHDGLVTIEVHQEIPPLGATSRGNMFSVIYYFSTEEHFENFKRRDIWRRWRRSVTVLQDGASRFQGLHALFDTRNVVPSRHNNSGLVQPGTPTRYVSKLREAAFERRRSLEKNAVSFAALSGQTVHLRDLNDLIEVDQRFEPHLDWLRDRLAAYYDYRQQVLTLTAGDKKSEYDNEHGFKSLAGVHKLFGAHCDGQGTWIVREWIPNVTSVRLMGDFNNWNRESHIMERDNEDFFGPDVWVIRLPPSDNGPLLRHRSKYKLHIVTKGNEEIDRVPPCAHVVWKSPDSDVWDGVIWNPSPEETYSFKHAGLKPTGTPMIYEAYIGLPSRSEDGFGTYVEFQEKILPRIKILGYNIIVLLGIIEHPTTTFGWHSTNMYASASTFGTPEELKSLIDAAHGLNISVVISIVHSHGSPSSNASLANISGSGAGGGYFKESRLHPQWDAPLFDLEKPAVARFLLGQLAHFADVYHIDGFRFEAGPSMLWRHHGIGQCFSLESEEQDFASLSRSFSFEADLNSAKYLMLANDFLHAQEFPSHGGNCTTFLVDTTRYPLTASPIIAGGLGFDYRTDSVGADAVNKSLFQLRDGNGPSVLPGLVASLEKRSTLEKSITYVENWQSNLRSRRPLYIAMFAWESLHTHAVGGVAPHVTELAAGLSRLGHEVHVFARAVGPGEAHTTHYGVQYHECPFQLNADFVTETGNMCDSFLSSMIAVERFMRRDFDVCHAHDWLAAGVLQRIKARFGGSRICILTMHSTEFGRCGNKNYGGDSRRVSDVERRACLVDSDRVICVSGVLATEVVDLFGVHRGKLRVIYNGINATNFDGFEDAGPIKAAYGISALQPVLLFVGRMVIQKGPDLLVEAIPYVLRFRSDTVFVFVGDGHMRASLEERARQLGVEHACRFVGARSGGELRSLFKACDAVIVPSRNEPFGIVVLESWSAFKPVVATTCGGPRDFVTPNVDGILVDPNPGAVAWGCCEILKNFSHAQWMGTRGRVKAAFNFSWDRIAGETATVYYEQANRHDAPYWESGSGEGSLFSKYAGCDIIANHMGVFDDIPVVSRGLADMKLLRLLVSTLAGDGYSTFSGSEFCHPGFVDVPRAGNSWSFKCTRRHFELAVDKSLRFKHLDFFDACIVRLVQAAELGARRRTFITNRGNEETQLVAYERGPLLIVFNFGFQLLQDITIGHSLQTESGPAKSSSVICVLNSDDVRFGGSTHPTPGEYAPEVILCDQLPVDNRAQSIKIPSLNSKSAKVYCLSDHPLQAVLVRDPVFSISDVDAFVERMSSSTVY